MARKVVWTDPAVADLESTVQFIAKDSPSYAAAFAQQVCDAGDSLAESSERGHRLEDPARSRDGPSPGESGVRKERNRVLIGGEEVEL